MPIYLYTAIPAHCEMMPIRRSTPQRLRNRAKDALNMLAWAAGLRADFHYSTYEDLAGSNVGDHAIRMALHEKLVQQFGENVEEIAWGGLDEETIRRINRDGSMVVVSAGAYLHFDTHGNLGPRLSSDLRQFERIACPIVSYGIGLSHKLSETMVDREAVSESSRRLLEALLRRLTICSVRDERSRKLLEAACPGAPVHVVPDPALFLESSDAPKTLEGDPAIGLNFAFHGNHTSTLLQQHARTYVALAARLLRAMPRARLYYFVHSDSERLICRLLRRSGTPFTAVTGDARELLAWYGGLDAHVGQMMHSCVLALNRGVPVVNLEYDTKSRQLMRSFGLERYCVPVEQYAPDTLADLVAVSLGERARLRSGIGRRLEDFRKSDRIFLAEVSGVLARSRR